MFRLPSSLLLLAPIIGVASACFAAPSCQASSPRAGIEIDSSWRMLLSDDETAPSESGAWKSVSVPQQPYKRVTEFGRYLWFKRDVTIPASWSGQRIFIDMRGARYAPELFVNGQLAGQRFNGWTPFSVEITRFVTPGSVAHLLIRCSDRRATLNKDGKMLVPCGGYKETIGIADDIILKAKPKDEIADDSLVITPSTRKKSLTVQGAVDGSASGLYAEAQVEDNGETVLKLGSAQVGADAKWSLNAAFKNPVCWSPENPHLYQLRVILRRGENGDVVDEYVTTFGFKEIWTEGADFYLNGVKRHLFGTAAWPAVAPQSREEIRRNITNVRKSGAIIFRLHNQIWPEYWLDEADKQGLLIIDETPLYTDEGGLYAYKSTEFWQNYRDLTQGMIQRDRNHASLAMWSLGNEILFMGNQKFDQDLPKKMGDIGRYAKSIDQAHPITFEADQDPDGAYDVIGLHYPHEAPTYIDYPNTADWLGSETITQADGGMLGTRSTSFLWDRKKPLYIGEYLWMPQGDYSSQSLFYGDEGYLNREQYGYLAKAKSWVYQSIGFRRSGVSGISPWSAIDFGARGNYPPLYAVQQDFYRPVASYIQNLGLRFFSGETATLNFDVFNDGLVKRDLVLKLIDENGKLLASSQTVLEPAGYNLAKLSVKFPKVSDKKTLAFDSVLYADGKEIHRDHHVANIYPRVAATAPEGFRVVAYDPSGAWPNSVRSLDTLPQENTGDVILVIAPNALSDSNSTAKSDIPVVGLPDDIAEKFQTFVRSGGRALVLEQSSLDSLKLGLKIAKRDSTMSFPLSQSNPILKGVSASDLSFWRGDNYISHAEIVRPTEGGAKAITVTGGVDGLNTAPILDLKIGEGRAIFLQALVGEKLALDPAASVIYQNAMNTLAEKPSRKDAPAAIIGSASFASDIAALNLQTTSDAAAKNLLIDGAVSDLKAAKSRIAATLSGGGTVYWRAPEAASFAALRDVLGANGLEVAQGDSATSIIDREDPLLGGVSREDVTYIQDFHTWDKQTRMSANAAQSILLPIENGAAIAELSIDTAKLTSAALIDSEGAQVLSISPGGSAQFSVNAPKDGVYLLSLDAKGISSPMLEVDINNTSSTILTLSKTGQSEYRASVALKAGSNDISLTFINRTGDQSVSLTQAHIYNPTYPTGAQVHLAPGALVTWPAGKGEVVFDGVAWNNAGDNATKGKRYASALLANLGFESKPIEFSKKVSFPLAGFKLVGESPYFEQNASSILLRNNGVIASDFECASAGTFTVRVSGSSTTFHGAYAQVKVLIDGEEVGAKAIASSSQAEFTVGEKTLLPGRHTLSITYINDESDAKEDRNLTINAAEIEEK